MQLDSNQTVSGKSGAIQAEPPPVLHALHYGRRKYSSRIYTANVVASNFRSILPALIIGTSADKGAYYSVLALRLLVCGLFLYQVRRVVLMHSTD